MASRKCRRRGGGGGGEGSGIGTRVKERRFSGEGLLDEEGGDGSQLLVRAFYISLKSSRLGNSPEGCDIPGELSCVLRELKGAAENPATV